MTTLIETIEHPTCDLCGREQDAKETLTPFYGEAGLFASRSREQTFVDVCPGCLSKPISDLIPVLYPPEAPAAVNAMVAAAARRR